MAEKKSTSKRGVIHLVGRVDDSVDFDALSRDLKPPIRLNFQSLIALTSLGTRRLRRFIDTLGDRQVEFHECTRIMVDVLNLMPDIVQSPGHRVLVRSVYVPYACIECHLDVDVLTPLDATATSNVVRLLQSRCHQCHRLMRPVVDVDDYFYFLS